MFQNLNFESVGWMIVRLPLLAQDEVDQLLSCPLTLLSSHTSSEQERTREMQQVPYISSHPEASTGLLTYLETAASPIEPL